MRIHLAWAILTSVTCCFAASGCHSDEAAAESSASEDIQLANVSTPHGIAASAAAAEPQNKADLLHPKVEIQTDMGNFIVELDAEHAPLTVDNFLSYVDSGQYDGTIFHQVLRDYVILGGGFTPQGEQKPAAVPIRNEAHNGLKNRRGTIAMARDPAAIDSSTCQFFINLADNPALDHTGSEAQNYGYAVFGKVIQGFDVVERIGNVEVKSTESFEDAPTTQIVIRSIRRLR